MITDFRKYSFDTFLKDESNLLALKAGMAVAEVPGSYINPLLIYGKHSCGKTHLLRAIGDAVRTNHPDLNVMVTTAEAIASMWISTLRSSEYDNSLEVLFELFRGVDVLLIDNLESIAGKSSTTDLMMKFIEKRTCENLQTVMVSADFEMARTYVVDEFRMRFRDGLMAYVDMASADLKSCYVKTVAEVHGAELDDKMVKYLSNLDDTPLAELKGIVLKVLLYWEVRGEMPDINWLDRNIQT